MIASWGMLAFLKAADTRQNASFAIRLDKKGEFDQYEDELRGEGYYDAEGFLREADELNPQRAADLQRADSRMPEHDSRDTRVDEPRHTRVDEPRHTRVDEPILRHQYEAERVGRGSRRNSFEAEQVGRSSRQKHRSIKYQDFDDFLNDNLHDSGYDHPNSRSSSGRGENEPLTLDDLFGDDFFGGDKK